MLEFLQGYGTWIILAGLFIVMLWMHAGGGCRMNHADHNSSLEENYDDVASPKVTDKIHATTHACVGDIVEDKTA